MPHLTLQNLYSKLSGVAIVTFLCGFLLFSCYKKVDVKQVPQNAGIIDISPSAGPKNTILSISGNNFPDKAGIVVKVNGKTTPIVSATSNNIQAQIQPGTGTGKVEVTFNGTTYTGPTFTYQNTYTVTSLTNGIKGYLDGPLSTAQFEDIEGIAIDPSDNIFPSDWSGSNNLRKINLTSSTVSTLATLDGGGEFLTTDAAGNIYFADEDDRQIIKVTPAGVATTLISTPTLRVQGVKVGASGNIYVSGNGSSTSSIAKYSPSGTLIWRLVSHGSGNVDGDTSVVKFALYGNIEVDPTETKIYVVSNPSSGPSKIKVLDLTAKTLTTFAGAATKGFLDGPALEAEFAFIYSITFDKQGGLYIADADNAAIRYLKNGVVTTVVGGNGSEDTPGIGTAAKLGYPQNVAFDSKGIMYIADWGNNKIYKVVID
ncbi:MAG TPA: hypothetical protein VGQ09_05295 [Chitinophagaceae bacterium]|jgi:hypothetical protein|nr:hypothetical protein [Chitinophagaceae bacterium]